MERVILSNAPVHCCVLWIFVSSRLLSQHTTFYPLCFLKYRHKTYRYHSRLETHMKTGAGVNTDSHYSDRILPLFRYMIKVYQMWNVSYKVSWYLHISPSDRKVKYGYLYSTFRPIIFLGMSRDLDVATFMLPAPRLAFLRPFLLGIVKPALLTLIQLLIFLLDYFDHVF